MVARTSMVTVVFTLLLVVGRKAVAAAAPTRYRHPSKGVALTRAFVTAPGFTKYAKYHINMMHGPLIALVCCQIVTIEASSHWSSVVSCETVGWSMMSTCSIHGKSTLWSARREKPGQGAEQ